MAKEQLKRTILTPVVKRTTGVYQIRCSDGRLYIGSSVDIRSRWSQHLQKLQRDSHSNWRLQQAWNKVNTTFEFSVLEVTDRDQLFAVEQKWIEETRCTDLELGFNIFDIAGSPGGRFSQTWEGFVDPHGNSVTIHNLFAFCREHQLDFAPCTDFQLA